MYSVHMWIWLFSCRELPITVGFLLRYQLVWIWHAAEGFPWQPGLSVQSGGEGFQIEKWSSGGLFFSWLKMLRHEEHPLEGRGAITKWDSAPNGCFDIPRHNWKHFLNWGVLIKMHWTAENRRLAILIPLMKLSAAACQACTIYVMTHPFVKLATFLLYFISYV